MTPKLMADGVTGKVAVFEVNDVTDRTPLDSPYAYLPQIKFHSDFVYPTLVTKYTGTLGLAEIPINSINIPTTHVLFAHGIGAGVPWVIGRLTSPVVPLSGSVPFQHNGIGYGRWLTLGADATNVVLHEDSSSTSVAVLAATSVGWEVWVTSATL